MSIVRGFESEASVTDAAAVASLLVLLHDVLQVVFALCKRQLPTQEAFAYVVSLQAHRTSPVATVRSKP